MTWRIIARDDQGRIKRVKEFETEAKARDWAKQFPLHHDNWFTLEEKDGFWVHRDYL